MSEELNDAYIVLLKIISDKIRAFKIPSNTIKITNEDFRSVLNRITYFEESNGIIYAKIKSMEAVENPRKTVTMKSLSGNSVSLNIGVSEREEYHNVVVSNMIMKCSCPIGRKIPKQASDQLKYVFGNQYPFISTLVSNHILCKHTFTVLVKALAEHKLSIDEELLDNITLSIIIRALASNIKTEELKKELFKLTNKYKL